jgi:hypothetical protein
MILFGQKIPSIYIRTNLPTDTEIYHGVHLVVHPKTC